MEDRLTVRASVPEDANPLTKILNNIIKVGGTTAMEELLSQAEFADRFLHGPDYIICNVFKLLGIAKIDHSSIATRFSD